MHRQIPACGIKRYSKRAAAVKHRSVLLRTSRGNTRVILHYSYRLLHVSTGSPPNIDETGKNPARPARTPPFSHFCRFSVRMSVLSEPFKNTAAAQVLCGIRKFK
jgi:hypothetical protein